MKRKVLSIIEILSLFLVIIGVGPTNARAFLVYGGGYYTNLCDSGTAATYYNCDPGCNPATGRCESDNQGAVKWMCLGKWNQCLESESQWSNLEKLDSVSCGYTVQLSKFDKKCRRLDGSWDPTCKLLGYMTWYSGDCNEGQTQDIGATIVPTVTLKPTLNPTPTTGSKLTNLPTNTPKPTSLPTPTNAQPAPGVCGLECKLASDCKLGFGCIQGVCRNPACPSDNKCFCEISVEASAEADYKKTPETGVETWMGMAGMVGLGVFGFRLRKISKKLW